MNRITFVFLAIMIGSYMPAVAGPQSLLDPYASIQPPSASDAADPSSTKKSKKNHEKKQPAVREAARPESVDTSLSSDLASPPKTKASKVTRESKVSSITSSPKPKASNDAGVISGLKATGHGVIAGSKKAGSKMVNGTKIVSTVVVQKTKVSGAYIASGTKALGGKMKAGVSVVAHKVKGSPRAVAMKSPASQARQENQISTASSVSPRETNLAALPGRPLEPVRSKLPQQKAKANSASKKQGVLAHTFGKLHVFGKHKSVQPSSVAANAQRSAIQ